MIDEPFATGESYLHRADPRHRIVAATGFSILVAVSSNITALVAALLFSLLLAALSRLEPGAVLRRLAVALGFLLLLWLVLPWTYEGQTVLQIGPIAITRQGLMVSLRITLKSVAILTALMALVSTMTTATLGHALSRLRVPDKIVVLLLIAYRYIFVIEQEYLKLARAAKVRGFRPKSDLHSYKTYAYLVGMLFVRAWNRADRVYQAMVCRGFKGRFYTLETFSPHLKNWSFDVLMSATLCVLAALEWIEFP